MTGVASVQQIAAIIREQLSMRIDGKAEGDRSKPARTPRDRQGSLSDLIAERVRGIAPDDPNRGRKALRAFLESVLLSEFDDGLVNDPEFHRMVDDIQRQMESDPTLAASIDAAVTQLTAPAPR